MHQVPETNMSSDNSINNDADLSGAIFSMNIDIIGDDDENTNEEKNVIINDTDNIRAITKCANCGKEGGDSMNTCNKCDLAVYCNAACKKKHKSKHKKKCERRAAELCDERLFNEPPPREDCPICMLPPPLYGSNYTGMNFYSCCGKNICNGCTYTMRETGEKNMMLCPFCKAPPPKSNEENVERVKKLMEKGNASSFYQLGGYYAQGIMGLPQDEAKANELYLKAGQIGCAEGYCNLGVHYYSGRGVEIDKKKAMYYNELAAMNGSVMARHNLGADEYEAGNYHRAMKHYVISARAGYKPSLGLVKNGYMLGDVTKEEYANALRAYQKIQDETKSDIRDKALAYRIDRMGG